MLLSFIAIFLRIFLREFYHFAMDSPSETFTLLCCTFLGGWMWLVVGNLARNNPTELFTHLVEPRSPICKATMSGGLQNSKLKTKSWSSTQTMLRLIVVAVDTVFDRIPEVQIVEFHPDDTRPRQPNVQPVDPKRQGTRGPPKRAPRQYGLRMKIIKRGDSWGTLTRNRQQKLAKKREEKARKAKEEENKVPDHWKNVSEEERLEDYERTKNKYLHRTYVQYDLQYGVNLDRFVRAVKPELYLRNLGQLSADSFLQTSKQRKSVRSRASQALIAAQQIRAAIDKTYLNGDASSDMRVYMSTDDSMPIVVDSGASLSLTPHHEDFVEPPKSSDLTDLHGLSGTTKVLGVGTVEWMVRDLYGAIRTIRCQAYYVPGAKVRLFSPQRFFQERGGGKCEITKDQTSITLPDNLGTITFPYHPSSNLPMMLPAAEGAVSQAFVIDPRDKVFQDKGTTNDMSSVFMNNADENNKNLTAAQRDLLLWHQKCGHADMQRLQRLAVWKKQRDGTHRESLLPVNFKSGVSSAPRPMCAACLMAKQTRRTPATENPRRGGSTPDEMVLRTNNLAPGAKVSVDQYLAAVGGRRAHTKGKEKARTQYQGGTIFVDHATQLIYVAHQVSMDSRTTIQSKRKYEKYCKSMGHEVKSYRADNQPFDSQSFRNEVENSNQTLDFSGVGAHHQNGVAERSIQTVTQWARAMLLHQMLHWPDEADHRLWPFALTHAVYLWNHLPKKDTLLAPIEVYAGTSMDHRSHFKRLHVWGAPVYVLDPKLQDGKKIPKWNPRSRQGMYLGFSPEHSSLVSNVMNVGTGHVGPQYHVVIDDLFTTVPNADQGGLYDPITFDAARWEALLETGYERHLEAEPAGRIRQNRRGNVPTLGDEWLTGPERRVRRRRRAAREAARLIRSQRREARRQRHDLNRHFANGNQGGGNHQNLPQNQNRRVSFQNQETQTNQAPFDNHVSEHDSDSDSDFSGSDDDRSVVEGDAATAEDPGEAEDAVENTPAPRPPRTPRPPRPRPRPPRSKPEGAQRIRRSRKPNKNYQGDEWVNLADASRRKVTLGKMNQQFLAGLQWANLVDSLKSDQFSRTWNKECAPYYDEETGLQDYLDPIILAAKANAEDNPTWHEAMNGPLKEGYSKAADAEIDALEHKDAWDVVEREEFMNVLPGTWAFKCKRFPDGSVRKLKARFCVRGDRQIQGIDFFETWAPVVNWNTVRLMLILSLVLGLATKQVDYTTAFLHAPIKDEVYVEMPRGYTQPGKVLRLNRSLYGLKQSPKNFFEYLKENLEGVGFEAQTDIDPCLFISEKCICLVYVDDTLFFSPDPAYIEDTIERLRDRGMELEAEDSVAGFLGVHIERNESDQSIKLTQKGLIKRIISSLETDKGIHTPTTVDALPIDPEGDPPDQDYNYASVVGMLLYLSGHSRPDICFAVSQVARFIHNHKRSHEIAIERIGKYLYQTKEEGLILKPSKDEFSMSCYVDSDFAGLWNVEDQSSPESVRSRAGYVICVCGCPIVWKSQLMVPLSCSTMQAEYNALSMAMKEVLPLQELFRTVGASVGIGEEHLTQFKTTVHEDNQGALKLANLEPGHNTPRSKHYGVRTHWFRSHLKPNRTEVVYVESKNQWADMLTKGLPRETFERVRYLFCGW